MFVQGKLYVRRDLHRSYGGQRQGGISTPSQHHGRENNSPTRQSTMENTLRTMHSEHLSYSETP